MELLDVDTFSALTGIIVGMGGWKLVSAVINRSTNKRQMEAQASNTELETLRKQIDWIHKKYEAVSKKLDNLYKEFRELEEEKVRLINDKNNLILSLKISEYEKKKISEGKFGVLDKLDIEAVAKSIKNDNNGIFEVYKVADKKRHS